MFKHLTQTQRYYICLQNARGITQTEIARAIKVDKSTVSRELKRNMRDVQRALGDIYLKNNLNNKPRKSLGFKTLNEIVAKYLERVSANLERRKKQLLHFNL